MKKVLILCAFIALLMISCVDKKVEEVPEPQPVDTTDVSNDSIQEVGIVIEGNTNSTKQP